MSPAVSEAVTLKLILTSPSLTLRVTERSPIGHT